VKKHRLPLTPNSLRFYLTQKPLSCNMPASQYATSRKQSRPKCWGFEKHLLISSLQQKGQHVRCFFFNPAAAVRRGRGAPTVSLMSHRGRVPAGRGDPTPGGAYSPAARLTAGATHEIPPTPALLQGPDSNTNFRGLLLLKMSN
jgi:hypothetical protein